MIDTDAPAWPLPTVPNRCTIWPKTTIERLESSVSPVLGTAPTTAVGTDVAEPEPDEFFAVTTALSVLPWSTETSVYDWLVAPLMSAQLPPFESQRRHWYVNVIGVAPLQAPFEDVSVEPT